MVRDDFGHIREAYALCIEVRSLGVISRAALPGNSKSAGKAEECESAHKKLRSSDSGTNSGKVRGAIDPWLQGCANLGKGFGPDRRVPVTNHHKIMSMLKV
jgi:hypothetical protein